MSHSHDNTVPGGALKLALSLVVFALLATTAIRVTGTPAAATPSLVRAAEGTTAVATRALHFADTPAGAVVITDAVTGRIVHMVAAGAETGFIRGVMRGLARDRRMRGVGDGPAFTLTMWKDGQLSLKDPATGREIELGAFGASNRAQFAGLLEQGK